MSNAAGWPPPATAAVPMLTGQLAVDVVSTLGGRPSRSAACCPVTRPACPGLVPGTRRTAATLARRPSYPSRLQPHRATRPTAWPWALLAGATLADNRVRAVPPDRLFHHRRWTTLLPLPIGRSSRDSARSRCGFDTNGPAALRVNALGRFTRLPYCSPRYFVSRGDTRLHCLHPCKPSHGSTFTATVVFRVRGPVPDRARGLFAGRIDPTQRPIPFSPRRTFRPAVAMVSTVDGQSELGPVCTRHAGWPEPPARREPLPPTVCSRPGGGHATAHASPWTWPPAGSAHPALSKPPRPTAAGRDRPNRDILATHD